MAKNLTRKQQLFVIEYVKTLDPKLAALAAGYSEKTAASQGSQQLNNPKIQHEIAKRSKKAITKLEISAENVFAEIKKLAFFDPRKLYNADGSMKAITELDDDTAAAIAGVDEEKLYERFNKGQAKNTGTIKKVKFVDKGVNLERLIKFYLRISEKHEHEIKNLSQMSDEQLAELAIRLGIGTVSTETGGNA